jgi:hypothetical protein
MTPKKGPKRPRITAAGGSEQLEIWTVIFEHLNQLTQDGGFCDRAEASSTLPAGSAGNEKLVSIDRHAWALEHRS